jgi:hypothetical protein
MVFPIPDFEDERFIGQVDILDQIFRYGWKYDSQCERWCRAFLSNEKGIRQRDPLSLFLFNIVTDMLEILIKRAREEGQIAGIVPHLVEDGISILQYAQNMKLLLCAFE